MRRDAAKAKLREKLKSGYAKEAENIRMWLDLLGIDVEAE